MPLSEKHSLRLLRVAAACLVASYTASVYFLSCLAPVMAIHRVQHLPVPLLLAMAIIGYAFAGVVFLSLLIATKRLCIGSLETGLTSVRTLNGQKWFFAATLISVLEHSPFKSMTVGISLFSTWFYRGMGARMPASVLIGKCLIRDPWFLEMGENVNIGTGSLLLGHLGHGKEIVLGKLVIGDDVIIGVNAVIFPDVRIGNNARVGAGAVVVRGTVIPDNETWVGIPARKRS
jgi:serine acetyltransferase